MIQGITTIRPRYDEVDQMGYVYHANYVSYCHQARTELLRTRGIHDKNLEDLGIMLPVIEMNLRYLKPAHYDETLTIVTTIKELPISRFQFYFKIMRNEELLCEANSSVVFVNAKNRKPMRCPDAILKVLNETEILQP